MFCPHSVYQPVCIPPRPAAAETGSGPEETQAEKTPSKPSLEFSNLGQPFPSVWPNTQAWTSFRVSEWQFQSRLIITDDQGLPRAIVFYSPLSRGPQELWGIRCLWTCTRTVHKGGEDHMLSWSSSKWRLQKADNQLLGSHTAAQTNSSIQLWPLTLSVGLSTAGKAEGSCRQLHGFEGRFWSFRTSSGALRITVVPNRMMLVLVPGPSCLVVDLNSHSLPKSISFLSPLTLCCPGPVEVLRKTGVYFREQKE